MVGPNPSSFLWSIFGDDFYELTLLSVFPVYHHYQPCLRSVFAFHSHFLCHPDLSSFSWSILGDALEVRYQSLQLEILVAIQCMQRWGWRWIRKIDDDCDHIFSHLYFCTSAIYCTIVLSLVCTFKFETLFTKDGVVPHPHALCNSLCAKLYSQPFPKDCNTWLTLHRQVMHIVVDFTIFIVEAGVGFYRPALQAKNCNCHLHLHHVQCICTLHY